MNSLLGYFLYTLIGTLTLVGLISAALWLSSGAKTYSFTLKTDKGTFDGEIELRRTS